MVPGAHDRTEADCGCDVLDTWKSELQEAWRVGGTRRSTHVVKLCPLRTKRHLDPDTLEIKEEDWLIQASECAQCVDG